MVRDNLLNDLTIGIVRESPFISKSANEWMHEAREKPTQRKLFGDL